MKKIYQSLLIGLLAVGTLPVAAQQLPNGGFDSWKSSCGSTEAFGTGGTTSPTAGEMRQRPGVEPEGWNGSNINQKVIFEVKKDELVTNGGEYAVLKNIFVGVGTLGSVAPGYITFGTPWVYAVSTLADCDGGTYGGINFTNKPDAITGKFKRDDANDENSYIIAYLWNGTYQSKVGKAGSPTQTRDNVDRAVMGISAPDKSGNLVASCNYAFKGQDADWKTITVPLKYNDGAGEPTMLNVVICSGDYWNRSALQKNTTLWADDIKFVYYSTAKEVSYNGTALAIPAEGETITVDAVYDESLLSYTLNGQSAKAATNYDSETGVLTITVSNVDADADGKSSHEYKYQFNLNTAPVVKGDPYAGYLSVKMIDADNNEQQMALNKTTTIYIDQLDNNNCTFALPDFEIIGMNVGTIEVPATCTTAADGTVSYNGHVADLALMDGFIHAEVTLSGTIKDTDVNMSINVVWKDEDWGVDMKIPVIFTSTPTGVVYYDGFLNIDMMGFQVAENESKQIQIYPSLNESLEPSCSVLLPDFRLESLGNDSFGDILVENVTTEEKDGVKSYTGNVEGMELADGGIVADVTLKGTINENNAAKMFIDVDWDGIAIPVVFTTNKVLASTLDFDAIPENNRNEEEPFQIWVGFDEVYRLNPVLEDGEALTYDIEDPSVIEINANNHILPLKQGMTWVKVTKSGAARAIGDVREFPVYVSGTTGVKTINVDNNAPVEYYDLRGIKVNIDNAAPGVYISRQGTKVAKVVVK